VDYWPEYIEQAKVNLVEAARIGQEIGDEEIEIDVATASLGTFLRDKSPADTERVLERLVVRRDPIRLNAFYFRMMWSTLSLGRFERCVEICDAGIELAYRIGTLPVQYPTIKAMALMELGRFGDAWQSLEKEIADEAHRFGAALRDMGKLQYEINVGAYEAALKRAPHVIAESRALVRAWMLRWVSSMLAGIAPFHAGDASAIANIEALVASTRSSPGTNGNAALALANGDLDRAQSELAAAGDRSNFSATVNARLTTLQLLASVNGAQGRWDAARGDIAAAVELARETSARGQLWRLLGEQALIAEKLGLADTASSSRAAAENLLSEISATIPDEQHRATLERLASRLGSAD